MISSTQIQTLAVVDLENLCGGSEFVAEREHLVRSVFSRYGDYNRIAVVASGPCSLWPSCELWWSWRDSRRLVRSGIDGADTALIEVLTQEPLARRMRTIEIWSGDGIFTDAALALRSGGATVKVFARPGSLSSRLRGAAAAVVELHELVTLDLNFSELNAA